MKSLILLLALLLPCEALASGWFTNPSCSGTALTSSEHLTLAPNKVLYNCVTDTSASTVLNVTAAGSLTLFSTALNVTVQKCADAAGTKCEDWWQAVNTSCISAGSNPCNHVELIAGYYKITAGGTVPEANALVGARGAAK